MDYRTLIVDAVVHKDTSAAWQIIQNFEPLINRKSYDFNNHQINEDLKSEIQIRLLHRILQNFTLQEGEVEE